MNGEHPPLSEDQKLLIRHLLYLEEVDTRRRKDEQSDQGERDRLTERLRFIEETVADVEGL